MKDFRGLRLTAEILSLEDMGEESLQKPGQNILQIKVRGVLIPNLLES